MDTDSRACQGETFIYSGFDASFWLRLLNTSLGWQVRKVISSDLFKLHHTVRVERIGLATNDTALPPSIVAKVLPQGRFGARASAELHKRLYSCGAPIPRTYWDGDICAGRYWIHLSEDLTATHEIFEHDYQWSQEQLMAIAEAVANFHAAGLRFDVEEFASKYPRMTSNPLNSVDGAWIRDLVMRAGKPPLNYSNASSLAILRRMGERYDSWLEKLSGWKTVIHGDIFWRNVAMREDDGGVWHSKLLDFEDALAAIPQYDIEYMAMRGWQTSADWDSVRDRHFRVLQDLIPDLFGDELLWQWGQRLALLQIMLYGMRLNIDRLDRFNRGEQLSPGEIARIRKGDELFDSDFINACSSALENDPWA